MGNNGFGVRIGSPQGQWGSPGVWKLKGWTGHGQRCVMRNRVLFGWWGVWIGENGSGWWKGWLSMGSWRGQWKARCRDKDRVGVEMMEHRDGPNDDDGLKEKQTRGCVSGLPWSEIGATYFRSDTNWRSSVREEQPTDYSPSRSLGIRIHKDQNCICLIPQARNWEKNSRRNFINHWTSTKWEELNLLIKTHPNLFFFFWKIVTLIYS